MNSQPSRRYFARQLPSESVQLGACTNGERPCTLVEVPLQTLSVDDVLVINRRVVEDARATAEPIAVMKGSSINSTLKDIRLLESAVGRQQAGTNGSLFHSEPIANAATLMFGLAKNHPFHDGNKRTALVSMLNHLDRNYYTLEDVRWQEIEAVVLELVVGKLPERTRLRHAVTKARDRSERDLSALGEWIRQNSRRIQRGERRMRFAELETLLKKHGFELADPDGNYISLYKVTEHTRKPLFRKPRTEIIKQHIGTIPYPGHKREIGILDIKQVRRICRLTEEHGADSAVFYDGGIALDDIINKNRRLLRSLAGK